MSYLSSLPDASLLDAFRAHPELARSIHEFAETLMRGPSPFSEGERELIAAYVSSLNGCDYCRDAHGRAAERFGQPEGLAPRLVRGIESAGIPDRLKPVLHYVRQLNSDPAAVSRSDVDAMQAAGWDDTAVTHAALVCGFFNLMNRWVEGLGIESDPGMVEMASRHLHEKGYRAISDMLDE